MPNLPNCVGSREQVSVPKAKHVLYSGARTLRYARAVPCLAGPLHATSSRKRRGQSVPCPCAPFLPPLPVPASLPAPLRPLRQHSSPLLSPLLVSMTASLPVSIPARSSS
eukprot:5062004-Prymnesium_polylepis.1